MMFPTLESERLTLDKLTMADAPAVFAYASNPEVAMWVDFPIHRSVEDAETFLSFAEENGENEFIWAIRLTDEKKMIGAIEFSIWDEETGDIHFCISQEFWGNGYVTEAAKRVLEWAKETYPQLKRVITSPMKSNVGSCRVLEKCGFNATETTFEKWDKYEEPVEVVTYELIIDRRKPWLFDEINHDGISYSEETIAEEYDENHLQFRDYAKEAEEIAELIDLDENSTVLDLGAGTGALSIELAKRVKSVHATDISKEMLAVLKRKAEKENLENVTTEQGGFLTFRNDGGFDAATSSLALHHLPDFWKQIAIKRIAESLNVGGRFLLADVIFDFQYEEYEKHFDGLAGYFKDVNPQMYDETIVHLRDEMSTFSWIIEKMLKDAGFRIDQKLSDGSCFVKYCCTRIK